ncbi:MAG: EamA family transporter [Holophaga sp.]|jgi:drug/metabolite transporter (DMT)-like permease
MFVLALVFVLASACLHALWNAMLKQARNLEAASVGILGVSVLVTAALLPWVRGPVFPGLAAFRWALAAGVGEGCYFVCLALALRSAPLGWSYTWMRGVGMLLVWPVSILWLGEGLHPLAAASVLVVCLGLLLMGLEAEPARGFRAVAWALATGVCIAFYTLCYKASLARGANPVGLFGTSMLVALPVQAAIRVRRRDFWSGLRSSGQWGRVVAAGILCFASFVLYLEALQLQGAGLMATLRNTSIVFAVVFSTLIGERPTLRQWAGAALVAVGAVGLAWPHPG